MFEAEQTTQNLGAYGPEAPLNQTISPLHSALNEQGEQLDKLKSLIQHLQERLQSISTPTPAKDKAPVGSLANGSVSSQAVSQLRAQTNAIREMQFMLQTTLDELEV